VVFQFFATPRAPPYAARALAPIMMTVKPCGFSSEMKRKAPLLRTDYDAQLPRPSSDEKSPEPL
jgi:hypothetical protein